ncbi:hypothetical protein IMSHALPRED_008148 [Imshaugia aleurites]|uniref:F-box domain-containing protein n=1 Tax=Imshaugia aleurites TaxID=172621 RepID=A0A8H3FTG7_9LECA|nr:hypothetical protein IMSHALPRED_008148 [Imshaugia aleurites]
MPACFSTLPSEVLLQITANVDKSGWLLDLALCCRRLYHLTIPHLYTDIKLFYSAHKLGFPYLKSFTIHVLDNPILASYVRGFALNQSFGDDDFPGEESKVQDIAETVQEVVFRSSFSQGQQEEFMRLLKNGDEDAYVALLLSSLPNLERLNIVEPPIPPKYFRKLVLKAARRERLFQNQPAFSALRVVVNNCYNDPYRTLPRLLSEYVRLPSLLEFHGHNVGSYVDGRDEGLAALEPATSPLVHLELRARKLNAVDLTHMLRAFKHLKTFIYEIGWANIGISIPSTLELGEALIWTEISLEDLWLEHVEYQPYSHQDFSPLRTLSNFKVLKNLRLGMYFCFDFPESGGLGYAPDLANFMPASIETLYFSHTSGRIHELTSSLEQLLQSKASCTPNLQRIAFEADITGQDYDVDYSSLDFVAEEVGVEIARVDSNRRERGQGKDGSLTVSLAKLCTFPPLPLFESLDIFEE